MRGHGRYSIVVELYTTIFLSIFLKESRHFGRDEWVDALSEEVTTRVSLLLRLQHRSQDEDWQEFVDIYGPLIYRWARRHDLHENDAADLMQEVLIAVVRSIARWRIDPNRGPFRAWLWTVTKNKLLDFRRIERRRWRGNNSRVVDFLDQIESQNSDGQRDWEETYHGEVLARALRLLRPQFSAQTWDAFEKVVLEEMPPGDVSAELGMSLNAVYVAKSRVLKRLRDEIDGLIE